MRHIPEPELHAYLDQALSRAQCVEIERHLAACAICQLVRDEIAALRDRTTALLSSLAPAVAHVPPFEMLRSKTAGALSARRRQRQRIIWAASVLGGIGLGWTAAFAFRAGRTAPMASTNAASPSPRVAPVNPIQKTSASVPSVATKNDAAAQQRSPAKDNVSAPVKTTRPATAPGAPSRQNVATAPPSHDSISTAAPNTAPARQVASLPASNDPAKTVADSAHAGNLDMSGSWQRMSWAGAQEQAGGQTPSHIDGLPVVDVQVQKNQSGERPTMVVVQQLSSGQVIRTIDGPTADVSRLLGHRTMTDPVPDSVRAPSAPATNNPAPRGVGQSMAVQHGNRTVVVAGPGPDTLSPDSLRAIMLRLHSGQGEQDPATTTTPPNVQGNGPARNDQPAPAQPNLPLTPPPQR